MYVYITLTSFPISREEVNIFHVVFFPICRLPRNREVNVIYVDFLPYLRLGKREVYVDFPIPSRGKEGSLYVDFRITIPLFIS